MKRLALQELTTHRVGENLIQLSCRTAIAATSLFAILSGTFSAPVVFVLESVTSVPSALLTGSAYLGYCGTT